MSNPSQLTTELVINPVPEIDSLTEVATVAEESEREIVPGAGFDEATVMV